MTESLSNCAALLLTVLWRISIKMLNPQTLYALYKCDREAESYILDV